VDQQQQRKLRSQEREAPREYLDRESHYVWGTRYLLKVVEESAAPKVELAHHKMILRVAPRTSDEAKREAVARWYREQIKAAVPDLIAKWGPIMGVKWSASLCRR
jgi:predicted metal-dependent hydrolase